MVGSVVVCFNLGMALTGEALLAAVDQFKGLPRAEIVRRCGYVTSGESGQERLNNTAFFEALLQAKGFVLGDGRGPGATAAARATIRFACCRCHPMLPLPSPDPMAAAFPGAIGAMGSPVPPRPGHRLRVRAMAGHRRGPG